MEDRIVKNFFKFYSSLNENPSRYLPKNDELKKMNLFKESSKKALRPEEKEIFENTRSRSAKLRYGIRNNNSFCYSKKLEEKFRNYLKTEESELWI